MNTSSFCYYFSANVASNAIFYKIETFVLGVRMTFSLLAMDQQRRFMVAVSATKTLSVGASVMAIRPKVGGVLSHACQLGPSGLALRVFVTSTLQS